MNTKTKTSTKHTKIVAQPNFKFKTIAVIWIPIEDKIACSWRIER